MSEKPAAVETLGLVKRFGDVAALDGFDIRVEAGEVHGLVGPNGAGKTTLLRILFALIAPDAGEVTLLGEEWDPAGGTAPRAVGGVVGGPPVFSDPSAGGNLWLPSAPCGV